jgi:hypothetical protein
MSVARSPDSGFERPIKGDLDRALSLLMHEHRHKVLDQVNNIKAQAVKAGSLRSNRLIVTCFKAADELHQEAMKQATAILFDFIERMQLPPIEITAWARPHLENLGNSLLGAVPPNGFPTDYKRIRAQYGVVFTQRLTGILRDVEIGFTKGAGFARAAKMESAENWISAAETVRLLKPVVGSDYSAKLTICERAYAGLIGARAETFVIDNRTFHNEKIPKEFWWAKGHAALEQRWETGDFSTWMALSELAGSPHLSAGKIEAKAFGVTFAGADIEKLIPAGPATTVAATPIAKPRNRGGRPKHDFWEDLFVAIAAQLYLGDLKPKNQADIERAMHEWITNNGHTAGETPVRERAQKLWRAVDKDGN